MNLMRHRYKAISRNLIMVLVLLCTVLLFGNMARASEPTVNSQTIPNPAQTGSLTVIFTNEEGEPDKFGNKVGIYKVADIDVEDGFSLVYDELFESVGDPPDRDAQLDAALAQKLNETADIKGISLDAPSEEVWSDGKVTFKDTEAGLYLVVQTYRVSDSEKSKIEPFLALIPERRADGTLNYDVRISPNSSPNRKPGSESQSKMLAEITKNSKLPGVGAPCPGVMPAEGALPAAGAMLIAGVLLAAAGCIIAKIGSHGHESV